MLSVIQIIGIIVLSTAIGALIAAKVEQQLLNILQGKAYRLGKSEEHARQYFVEERRFIHPAISVAGVIALATALMLFGASATAGWTGMLLGVGLIARG